MTGRRATAARAVLAVAVLALTVPLAPATARASQSGGAAGTVADADAGPVGVRTKTFVDRRRATPADVPAGITPADERRLETTIYYPARGTRPSSEPREGAKPARGRHPLILFSPGAPGTPADYEVLLADWAAAGYVVAAVQFPVSSLAGPDDVAWADLPAQAKDVRFVLTKLLDLDAKKLGIPRIDDERVAAAGHSFGGANTLALVSKCCRDRRVRAAVVLAGVTETIDGPQLRKTRGPLLFVHARGDRAVSYADMLEVCERTRGPKRLLTIEQIRGLRAHVQPYLGKADDYSAVTRPAVVDFLDGYVRGKDAARQRLERAGEGTTVAEVTRCRPADGDGKKTA